MVTFVSLSGVNQMQKRTVKETLIAVVCLFFLRSLEARMERSGKGGESLAASRGGSKTGIQ